MSIKLFTKNLNFRICCIKNLLNAALIIDNEFQCGLFKHEKVSFPWLRHMETDICRKLKYNKNEQNVKLDALVSKDLLQ